MFGVSFSVMRPLAKRAKRDQALARGLWATGNYDARILACMVADPAVATEAELDAWLAEIDVYTLVDIFVVSLASQVPGVRARADRWSGGGPRLDVAGRLGPVRAARAQRPGPRRRLLPRRCSPGSRPASTPPATAPGTA